MRSLGANSVIERFFVGFLLLSTLFCLGQGCPTDEAATGVPGPAGPEGPQGPPGPQGSPGPAGADGQLRIYGNGSAGDLLVGTSSTLGAFAATGNYQFVNVTINGGVTLTVASGTIIRCTGTFRNNGTIVVSPGAAAPNDLFASNPGISLTGAEPGHVGTSGALVTGGAGGIGLGADQAVNVLYAPVSAGGAGGATGFVDFVSEAGEGGGSFIVLAQGALENAGLIQANGTSGPDFGGGGGAGGIVILASPTSITSSGSIEARGASGMPTSGVNIGAGGGGGGGIIHLIAPGISAGTLNVSGGTGGTGAIVAMGNRAAGGGGGACGGSGGRGGQMLPSPADLAEPAAAGGTGHTFQTLADPTALFW